MKHVLLFFIVSVSLLPLKGQPVFCPPGATWSYNFLWTAGGHQPSQYLMHEKISYDRDSVVDNTTVKVLTHKWFYLECGQVDTGLTLIRQRHDTVFMRNESTDHNWEILYDLGAQPGQSWTTTIKDQPGSTFAGMTYTVTVDSIRTITENGFPLKHLFVRYTNSSISHTTAITERFGCNRFMFNYYNVYHGSCDGDIFMRFLCYKDDQFGTKQFTEFHCEYPNFQAGINTYQNENGIRIYPNPANSFLNIETDAPADHRVQLSDVSGKVIMEATSREQNIFLDTDKLAKGFYIVKVYKGSELQTTRKVVKE